MTGAVVRAAASGDPPQRWAPEPLSLLIREMDSEGGWKAVEAEVESAYVQIVSRSLW